jgi:hypothetical protein
MGHYLALIINDYHTHYQFQYLYDGCPRYRTVNSIHFALIMSGSPGLG